MSSNNQVHVAKFGGTSLANFDAMSRCASIVLNDPQVRVVVVSASSGVTNLLVKLSDKQTPSHQHPILINEIRDIQNAILNQIEDNQHLSQQIERLLAKLSSTVSMLSEQFSNKTVDEVLSYGEQMSSLIFAQVLNQIAKQYPGKFDIALAFDVRKVMRTDSNFGHAQPQIDEIKRLSSDYLASIIRANIVITQGFIGSDKFDNTTTLGRGGSDYTAALLSEALNASEVQIWTDVPGIYTTDPRITGRARPMNELSFSEAAELATFGAKVLHPSTILPASRANIDVFVGSSVNPELGGTWIKQRTSEPGIRAIALRENQTLLTVSSPAMLHASGFLARVFAILAKYDLSVDLITTSEISVALTIDKAPNEHVAVISEACLSELKGFCEVKVETGLALIAAIGNHTVTDIGNSSARRLFESLAAHPLRMICHGASIHNICFLVDQSNAKSVVQSIHDDVFTFPLDNVS